MDYQSFDILEEKITRIISRMNRLKVENQEIKQENQELKSIIEEKDQELNQLRGEINQIADVQHDIDSYKENQNRIRSKVEVLLHKLKEFDDLQ